MDQEPIAVALKFGFIAVLYLFLLWIARSGLKDLRRGQAAGSETGIFGQEEAHSGASAADGWLVIESGPGLAVGERLDLFGGLSLGRSAEADVTLEDSYASQLHARVSVRRGAHYVEDMNSTNGTFLNGQPLRGEARLAPEDRIRIGESEFRFELGGAG